MAGKYKNRAGLSGVRRSGRCTLYFMMVKEEQKCYNYYVKNQDFYNWLTCANRHFMEECSMTKREEANMKFSEWVYKRPDYSEVKKNKCL